MVYSFDLQSSKKYPANNQITSATHFSLQRNFFKQDIM